MVLWNEWWRCVAQLRPACARAVTFMWMALVLLGMSIRLDLAGVTSFVRASWLLPGAYRRLLHLFHTPALRLPELTSLWTRLALTLFTPLRFGGRPLFAADGLKVPKEGRKMPAVKHLHQESSDNSKPEFISGHSFQALGLLVQGPLGQVFCTPLTSKIHEGLVFSNRCRRSLLDKLVAMFLPVAALLDEPALLVADAYYASRKVILPLLAKGHHLVTRVRSNTVAWQPVSSPRIRRPGRPRLYGDKIRLAKLWSKPDAFTAARSPVYGETNIEIKYLSVDLLWRPVGQLVRFVFVDHPLRGRLILMTSDLTLSPLDVIAIYGYRFKIEVGFKQAIHTLGTYAYHFWMQAMTPRERCSGDQYLHRKSEEYRRLVRRKMDAYHRYVQLGCIAQGILQHLSLRLRKQAWNTFTAHSWMRTMATSQPPSEAVVAHALRVSLPAFLLNAPKDATLKIFLLNNADLERCPELRLSA
jgi:hypothetical protein